MRHLPLVVLLTACAGRHSTSATRDPADYAPLPPDRSTSVGVLIQNKSTLALSDEQLSGLQELEDELQARNKPVDRELEKLEGHLAEMKKKREDGGDSPRMPGGGGRGRMGGPPGGGMGGPPGGGMGGPPGGGMGGGPPGGHRPSPEEMPRVEQGMMEHEQALQAKKAENNTQVLQKAWQLLDREQRVKASAVLDEAGHEAPPSDGEQGAR